MPTTSTTSSSGTTAVNPTAAALPDAPGKPTGYGRASNLYGAWSNVYRFNTIAAFYQKTWGALRQNYEIRANSSGLTSEQLSNYWLSDTTNFDKMQAVFSRHFAATTAIGMIGYASNTAGLPSVPNQDRKELLRDLTIARRSLQAVVDAGIYIANVKRLQNPNLDRALNLLSGQSNDWFAGTTQYTYDDETKDELIASIRADKENYVKQTTKLYASFTDTIRIADVGSDVFNLAIAAAAYRYGAGSSKSQRQADALALAGNSSLVLGGMLNIGNSVRASSAVLKMGQGFSLASNLLAISSYVPLMLSARNEKERGLMGAEIGRQVAGGLLQVATNAMMARAVIEGVTTGTRMAAPMASVLAGALTLAISPIQIAGLVQQSSFADKLASLGAHMESLGYGGDSMLAGYYRDLTTIQTNNLASTSTLAVIGGVTQALALAGVMGVTSGVGLGVGLVVGIASAILVGVEQAEIERVARDYADKIRAAGGSQAFFDRNLQALASEILNAPEIRNYLSQQQATYNVDSVAAVTTTSLSSTARQLAGLTRNGARLSSTATRVDRYAQGQLAADNTITLNPATGKVELPSTAGQSQLLTFLTPLMAPGEEKRKRTQTGKNTYTSALNVMVAPDGWSINDGDGSTVIDARKIVSTLYGKNKVLIADVPLTINAGAGDDMLVAGASTTVFNGGSGSNMVSYAEAGDGVSVRIVPTATGFTVEKTLANADAYLEQTATDKVKAGKRTEKVQYRDVELTQVSRTVTDTLTDVDNLRGASGNDSITGNERANLLMGASGNDTLLGGAGDDTLMGGPGADLLDGGDGSDWADFSDLASTSGIYAQLDSAAAATVAPNAAAWAPALRAGSISAGRAWDAGRPMSPSELPLAQMSQLPAVMAALAAGDSLYNIENLRGSAANDWISGTDGANMLLGADGNDTIYGLGGDDIIDGGAGNNMLYGGDGDDTFLPNVPAFANSPAVNDTIDGGDGDDLVDYSNLAGLAGYMGIVADLKAGTVSKPSPVASTDRLINIENINGTAGNDRITGSDGDNIINGADGADFLYGEGGDDILTGGDGIDYLHGGDGNDTLGGGAGEGHLWGDGGNDLLMGAIGYYSELNGGDGIDTADFSLSEQGIVMTTDSRYAGQLLVNAAGTTANTNYLINIENIVGTDFADRLLGTSDDNQIDAGNGNDSIDAGDGDDLVYGDAGDDSMLGGAGHDQLVGGDGNDTILGGADSDTIFGGAGNDSLFGGDGDDRFYQSLGDGADTIDGGAGTNTLDYGALASGAPDGAQPQPLANWLAGLGADALAFMQPFGERLRANNAAASLNLGLVADMASGRALAFGTPGSAGTWNRFSNITNLVGSTLDDAIVGDASDNALAGRDGNDSIDGGAGNDMIEGDGGRDFLRGQAGDDLFIQFNAGEGDTLDGGDGSDTLDYSLAAWDGSVGVTVNLAVGAVRRSDSTAVDLLSNIENVEGSPLSDVLKGSAVANLLNGGAGDDYIDGAEGDDGLGGEAGNDTLVGAAGDDYLDGGIGDDSLLGGAGTDALLGDDGNDYLDGGDGGDVLLGMNGKDTLIGGAGEDTLEGGAGDDSLVGGAGRDIYVFASGFGHDVVSSAGAELGQPDVLDFGDTQPARLAFSRVQNDLRIALAGADDYVTVSGWFTAGGGAYFSDIRAGGMHLSPTDASLLAASAQGSGGGAQLWRQ